MARFENGWVKFYRRAWEEDIGSNIYCLCLWVALLSMAHWKESKFQWEGKQRTLPPGSVVFGIKELADKWGCSRSVIKKWLHYLNDTGRIVLETSPRGCLATICNWEKYQSAEEPSCSPQDRNATTTRQQRDNNEPLIEEVKKERREEVNSHSLKIFKFELGDFQSCIDEWKLTLKHFEIDRPVGERDHLEIGRAIQSFGADWVKLAFAGARKQKAGKSWDPKQFVSLKIYLDPKRIERLVNIGAGKESADGIDWGKVFA